MAIQLSKNGNAVKFDFDDNSHYLNDGTIEVPVNSLTLVTDESDMFTFKKAASDDIFISGLYSEIGMSKSELIAWYKDNMVGSTGGGGGGVTSGEVQTMIDESISGKADTSDVQNVASDVATVSGDVNTLSGSVESNHNAITALNGDVSSLSGAVANKADTTAVTASINAAVSGKMDTSVFNTYSASTDARISEDEEVTSAALNELNTALEDKADTTAVTASIAAAVSGKQDTLIAGTNITISGNVISAEGGGGNNVIELTQAQYDALTDIDPDAFYIITDADGGATTGQVQTMINTAIATKQDTLVSGTNIKTINNESLLGSGNIDIQGGGKAIEAGRGIAITTGETADTVSFNLPISANTSNNGLQLFHTANSAGTRGFAGGEGCKANGTDSFAYGLATTASKTGSAAFGFKTEASVETSFICGKWNTIADANTGQNFGSSGNTVFAIGNGWKQNDWTTSGTIYKHNAIDIRQNGDIYIADTNDTTSQNWYEKPMIKLQDALGGGGLPESAFTAYTASTEARLAEDEEVTAAALNTLSTALGGFKLVSLTQAQYDALTVKDASTLYLITNVVN